MQPTLLTKLTPESENELYRIAGTTHLLAMMPNEALMLSAPSSAQHVQEVEEICSRQLHFHPEKACMFIRSDYRDRPHVDEMCVFVAASRNGLFEEYELIIVPDEKCTDIDAMIANLSDVGVAILYDARQAANILRVEAEEASAAELNEQLRNTGRDWLVSGDWLSVEQDSSGFTLRYSQEIDETFAADNVLWRASASSIWLSSLLTAIQYVAIEHWNGINDPFAPAFPAQTYKLFEKVAIACGYGGEVAERICLRGDFPLETVAASWLISDSFLFAHEESRRLDRLRMRMEEISTMFLEKLEEAGSWSELEIPGAELA